jgi:hypothetical protein
MTESEVVRDLHAVVAKVQQGVEVVVERDHRPLAVIRSPLLNGRLLSECVALSARNSPQRLQTQKRTTSYTADWCISQGGSNGYRSRVRVLCQDDKPACLLCTIRGRPRAMHSGKPNYLLAENRNRAAV